MSDGNTRLNQRMFALAIALLLCCAGLVAAQQTTAFTYQGKLTDAGNPASGAYQLQFKLFDVNSTQIGATISDVSVTATAGVFTTTLDFGAAAFPGADRFLEIAVRHNAGEAYTILNPRQQISSSPYSIRSANATNADAATTATNSTQLGGVAAANYVQTNDTRLTDARAPTAGSANYIQNTDFPQAGDFNITGKGTVGSLTAVATGASAVIGQSDTNEGVVGIGGAIGVVGAGHTGVRAVGDCRGCIALETNGTSWFQGNTTALKDTSGTGVAIGTSPGIGYIFAYDYGAASSQTLALNSPGGNVGIGTLTPSQKLTIQTATSSYGFIHTDGTITVGSFVGGSGNGGWYGTKSNHPLFFFTNDSSPRMTLTTAGNVGIGTTSPLAKLDVAGTLKVDALAGGGDQALCRNSTFNTIATCSSSLRYKKQIAPYRAGLDLITRLHPISFAWKANGTRDLGLGAEDVAKVEPLLVTHNDKGEIEGVKYAQLSAVLINAIKEQQQEIEQLRTQVRQLRRAKSHRRKR